MSWKIHAISQFDFLQDDWQRLNREGYGSPLLALEFVRPLLQAFGTGRELIACLHHENCITAMLILTRRGSGSWTTFQPAQAPLGACVHATADWPDCLTSLMPRLPGMALVLGVTQQDPDLQTRPSEHAALTTLDYIKTAKITLSDNFEVYWNARGKNLRQNMKKQRARLEKEGVTTRLQITTAPEEMALAVADYGRLESSGWKGEKGSAVHADNAQGMFYRSMLEAFCRQGRARVFRYLYDARLVAMDLCIEGDDHIVILKTTYDESIGNATSPALLMRQEAFAGLFAEPRLHRIEFFGKIMDWHTRWSDESRTMYHLNLYRWPALGLFRKLLRKLKN